MAAILVIGELCPDIVLTGVPVKDGRLRFGQAEELVTATTLTLGGSAAITASAAVRAGTTAALVAVVGDDDLGRSCLLQAAGRGIDLGAVRVAAGLRTGSSVILVSDEGDHDRQILTDLGTMRELRVTDVPDELLACSGHVHVSSFFMHTGARERLHERLAGPGSWGRRSASTPTTTRPGPGDGARRRRSPRATCCSATTPRRSGSPASATAPTPPRRPPPCCRGCRQRQPPGADWPEALRLGVAAASLSLTAAGGVTGQPRLPEASALAGSLATDDRRTDTAGDHRER